MYETTYLFTPAESVFSLQQQRVPRRLQLMIHVRNRTVSLLSLFYMTFVLLQVVI